MRIILSGVIPIHLRTARERRGWTQEQLEAASGIAQAVISRLENDRSANPTLSTVRKLASALRVDSRRLRFGPEPKEAVA